jgi:hypothetical protein
VEIYTNSFLQKNKGERKEAGSGKVSYTNSIKRGITLLKGIS